MSRGQVSRRLEKIGKRKQGNLDDRVAPGSSLGTEFPEEALWALWGVDARQD